MSKTEFLKDQVLVTKGTDARTRQPTLVECVFVRYMDPPVVHNGTPLDCVVKGGDRETMVSSENLANILHAEAVMQRHQQRAYGF